MRLDQTLTERGLAPSRSRARDAILRGHVRVNGIVATRPAMNVGGADTLEITDPAAGYVSRAALKLAAGLDHFGYDPTGRTALDIGASTGGFTQVLLERGAAKVIAVDVGHGQMAPELADDRRVRLMEGVNARYLTGDEIGAPIDALVSDVSFISQRLALPPALDLCEAGAFAVVLAKPQFELGREALGKDGVVRDTTEARRAADDLAIWLDAFEGWHVDGLAASPIEGGDGNAEYLIGARRDR